MKITIEISDAIVRDLIVEELSERLGANFDSKNVEIKVRSSQNYREHEFESGEIKATYVGEI